MYKRHIVLNKFSSFLQTIRSRRESVAKGWKLRTEIRLAVTKLANNKVGEIHRGEGDATKRIFQINAFARFASAGIPAYYPTPWRRFGSVYDSSLRQSILEESSVERHKEEEDPWRVWQDAFDNGVNRSYLAYNSEHWVYFLYSLNRG